MPAFRYEAVDAAGATKKGVVNADSARSARADLRSQGLVPIKVDAIEAQVDASGATSRRGFGEKLSTVELALFTRQLASLLEAGLPLEQAFTALLEQAERQYVRDLVASIRSEVMGGFRCRTRCRATRAISRKSTARWSHPASRSASCRAFCRAWPTISNAATPWCRRSSWPLPIRPS